jgi:hypothetical protein
MEFFDKALSFLTTAQGASATIIIILEFFFRMFKTEKPTSMIYLVANCVKKSGELLTKLGEILDKILPQRLK